MKAKFLHFSDVHLGYQQYNLRERYNDFGRAFFHVVDDAISRRVDFVLLGGDLFHKRGVDPLTLAQALEGLTRLRDAGIPVIAVEGNHERPHYRDEFGWMDFLDRQGYLVVLNPTFDNEGNPVLTPYQEGKGGAYVDIKGARIYGVKYYGASTARVVEALPAALAEVDNNGFEYTVMLLHGGLEGVLTHASASVDYSQLTPLQKFVDYLAMGHLHKPFERDGWIHNPGSLETVSIDEVQWPERGYYFVEVDTSLKAKHCSQLIACPRRAFVRVSQDVTKLKTPQRLYDTIERLVKRGARQVSDKPIVEIELHGALAFDRGDLDLDHVRSIVAEAFDALHVIPKNAITPTESGVVTGRDGESRPELEHRVLKELLERDARFRSVSNDWAEAAMQVKRMVLEDTSPAAVVKYLRERYVELMGKEA